MTEIAIVGMDCRLPGAPDVGALWELLLAGANAAEVVPPDRWDIERFHGDGSRPGRMNTRYAHFITDADQFDHEFFGIAPVEAAALDPQQRLVLQSAWRALEDGGVDPRSLAGTAAGVFVGMMSSEWSALHLLDYPGMTAQRGVGGGHCMVANRVSYHLNLTGPSVSVDTACSSSLMAVQLATQALSLGDTELAIVAGINLLLTPALSIFYTQAGLSAPDGRCKPFGADADGIGRGEGVGTVVLRRLEDALADGQQIYAVIAGGAANQDGKSNGITAPSRWSQTGVMRKALERAGAEPADITFVEAHGTGTVLGDMIEANALGDLHRGTDREQPVLVGSIKGNIGHAEGAAGIAALIKTALALSHRVLPPSLAAGANPALRLEQQCLQLVSAATPLPAERVLAGVSSFGLGGSNVHLVLASPPRVDSAPAAIGGASSAGIESGVAVPDIAGVLTVSAPTPEALRRNAALLADTLELIPDAEVAAFCRSTNRVKASLRHRLSATGSREQLIRALRTPPPAGPARPGAPRTGLLCSGQGAQYPGMTAALYRSSRPYREHLRAAAVAVDATLDAPRGLLDLMFTGGESLHRTEFAQPALFAVSYALGRALLDCGLEPEFLIGHSVGEFAAACLAEVLTLEEAARLVVARGRIMQRLPAGGAMSAIDAPVDEVRALLAAEPECGLAAVNGPRSVVVAGPAAALARVTGALPDAKITELTVSHAFHSPLMAPARAEFRAVAADISPRKARIPLFSTVRGVELDGPEMDAEYWTAQLTEPVRFAEAVTAAAAATEPTHLVELGPRSTLLALARRCEVEAELLPCATADDDGTGVSRVLAHLYQDGLAVRFDALYPELPPKRLPPYSFGGVRFWHEFVAGLPAGALPAATPVAAVSLATAEVAPVASGGVADTVLAVVAEIGGYTPAELDHEMLLSEDLGYDSLLQLRLIDRLRVDYPQLADAPVEELLPVIKTVGDIVGYVAERVESTAEQTDSAAAAVLAVIAEIGGYTVGELEPTALLSEDLGYDSLLQLRLIDRLRVDYPQLADAPIEELLPAIRTVADVIGFVITRLPAAEVVR